MSNEDHGHDTNTWSDPVFGTIDGHEVTASFGTSEKNAGETLLADGDKTGDSSFFDHDNHDHYGSGQGHNDNGTSRGAYTGPDH